MNTRKIKIIVIYGPTAVGKSALAVKIARRFGGEVISADSRQVYRGLNIATGKITKREMLGVPHHLLDVVSPKTRFNANRYAKLASPIISKIIGRGKLPIICGGTGFYISALLNEVTLAPVPPNKILRKKLSKKSVPDLFKILKKLDPVRAEKIDKNNPHRLIRAIEIASTPNNTPKPDQKKQEYDILKIGLSLPKEKLKEKINKRVDERIKKGITGELKKLHINGLSFKKMEELGLECRIISKYLRGEIDKDGLVKQIKKENWLYAKRQLTWFKKDKKIQWFSPTDKSHIERAVENHLRKNY